MSYEGRSPINDVVRSVVMGAAMISPALLAACRGESAATPPPDPLPEPTATVASLDAGGPAPTSEPSATAQPTVTAEPTAPPTTVVRPRPTTSPTHNMPTRGFAGAVRARRA
ncbi:MAG TPA: hypothetical protein VGH28_00160 [Polyangiaceae bacterium]|jgi:hypothetical protein